jgi:probable rRNA maturation factor
VSIKLDDVPRMLRPAVSATLDAVGVTHGHLAIDIVDEAEIRKLNQLHRGKDEPTDVLAFPMDGTGYIEGPRELGDVVICAEHTEDVQEAAVHGVLHLCGYDHETDSGEMLELQAKILATLGTE